VSRPIIDKAKRRTALSDRERQILGMAAAGMLDKQIGLELGISLNTLRTYWTRIRAKLGDVPRAALVAEFVKADLHREDQADTPVTHEGWILDVPTMMMTASDSINHLHGLERGVEHPVAHYSRLYHPEDREVTRQALFDVIEGRVDSVHLVFRLALDSGIELVNLSVHSASDKEGRVTKVYGYRARSRDCRVDHDPSVRIGRWERLFPEESIWIDDELAAIIGRPGGGTYDLNDIALHVLTRDRDQLKADTEEAIQTGKPYVIHDGKFRHVDGTEHWCRISRTLVQLEDGRFRVYGTLAIFR
jgi:DNA-binding CsgD family transcriptional regulator